VLDTVIDKAPDRLDAGSPDDAGRAAWTGPHRAPGSG
jgi:hypothetical protein